VPVRRQAPNGSVYGEVGSRWASQMTCLGVRRLLLRSTKAAEPQMFVIWLFPKERSSSCLPPRQRPPFWSVSR